MKGSDVTQQSLQGGKKGMTFMNPFTHLLTEEKNAWENGKDLGERTAAPNNGDTSYKNYFIKFH